MGIEWPTIRSRSSAAGPVAALIIGARRFSEPDAGSNPGFQSFEPFENLFFFGPDEVFVILVVANLGTSTVTGEVTIKVKGPVKDKGSLDVTLPGESGLMTFLRLNAPDEDGLYKLTGKLIVKSVGGSKTAKGAFGITASAITRQ